MKNNKKENPNKQKNQEKKKKTKKKTDFYTPTKELKLQKADETNIYQEKNVLLEVQSKINIEIPIPNEKIK
jgi:hypothetical protein